MAETCCGQEEYQRGERPRNNWRLQLIDQIKEFIGVMEDHEKGRGSTRQSGPRGPAGVRNMDRECLQYRRRRECSPPTITALSVHETRPTSHYTEMRHENSRQLTYVDASSPEATTPMPPAPWELPRTPSQELRAGTLYVSCDCRKRNGLQQDCPRWGCGGRPECVATSPGPCCETSAARKPVRGDHRQSPASASESTHHRDKAEGQTMTKVEPVPFQQGVYRVTHSDHVTTQTPPPSQHMVCACVPVTL